MPGGVDGHVRILLHLFEELEREVEDFAATHAGGAVGHEADELALAVDDGPPLSPRLVGVWWIIMPLRPEALLRT